ncbi:MAG: CHAT domain-containing protein [Thiomargarita sp.]|nr:CHAT domain-containing protein [Thiomargarita sp.]
MFSVHGIIPSNTNQITQPALALSNPQTEGFLTMADAFSLSLNADFVNLSACNTGCSKNGCSENVRWHYGLNPCLHVRWNSSRGGNFMVGKPNVRQRPQRWTIHQPQSQ